MARVFEGERTFLSPSWSRSRSAIYRVCGVDPASSSAGPPTPWACCSSTWRACCCSTPSSACRASCPSTRRGLGRSARPWPSTRRSASPPTPTGRPTSGETTMSYLTQMAGLAFHNFVSAATGIAIAIALVRGPGPALGERHRQLLGGPGSRHPLRPAADLHRLRAGARLAGRAAEPQPLHARRRRWRARPRPSPRGRSPPRRSSRSWAPTAAASSTPTRPTPTRTRTR